MKAYTDLNQSKKLAEILPLESADHFHIIGHLHTDGPKYEVIRSRNEVVETDKYWPCWSLAALLGVIPNKLKIAICINDFQNGKDKYAIGSVEHDNYDCYADNLVDACYEMIIKLNELKML